MPDQPSTIPERIRELAGKWKNGSLSQEEQRELDDWFMEIQASPLIVDPAIATSEKAHEQKMLDNIRKAAGLQAAPAGQTLRRIYAYAAAACLLLVLGATLYLLLRTDRQPANIGAEARTLQDIPPGKEGAILTLADGRVVVLDSLANGIIDARDGVQVELRDGQLAYNPTAPGTAASQANQYNALTTPKGRQFHLVLPDGTHVWLNAASTIRYPTVFSGPERRVELSGEAYFEVTPHKQPSFKVMVNEEAEVEALGTQFNINAYANEKSLHTTLLQGSLKVSVPVGGNAGWPGSTPDGQQRTAAPTGNSVLLKPGQQARIMHADGSPGQQGNKPISVVSNADIDQVMAWRNGAFDFNNAGLVEVMQQLERWYDIEVVYEKNIPNIRFGGKMSRNMRLDGVLRSLGDMGVRFRLEDGRRLVVYP